MISRRLPIPITFLVVMSAVIFLIIFFGAWAVSADVGDRDRALSFGFGGIGAPSTQALNSADASASENDSDSWWENAFLKACPFH